MRSQRVLWLYGAVALSGSSLKSVVGVDYLKSAREGLAGARSVTQTSAADNHPLRIGVGFRYC
jgi:hypothetical protein